MDRVLKFAFGIAAVAIVSVLVIDRILPRQPAQSRDVTRNQPVSSVSVATPLNRSTVSQGSLPGRAVQVKAGRNGHFFLNARVNGASVPFIVDTGASSVALSHEAARRARIVLNDRDYTIPVNTANGQVRAAPIVLDSVRFKSIRLQNVQAVVLPQGALNGESLLGNSFLSRLRRFQIENGTLLLQP